MVVSGHSQSLPFIGLSKSLPLICQPQSRLNYKRRIYTLREHLKDPAWVIREAVPLDPVGHLLHYATLPRQGVIAALPNTQKPTQGGYQNGDKETWPK